MNKHNITRYLTREVKIGDLLLGGQNPIRIQSMTNTDTNNIRASVEQCKRIIDAGGELVRLTAQGTKEAENLKLIKAELRDAGYHTPLVADIHFNPKAAEIAAQYVEKVRINPGNFVDKRASFTNVDYTDLEYKLELERIHERLLPLLKICRENGTALRIGTNHGSLSDRIMSKYGDTPNGMAHSAMEFLRILEAESFHNVVLSMKSSNTRVMVHATRMVTKMMQQEGMNYPLHLGVTEAGEGEDGRIKSAVGIGTLLSEGLGDTIRISLTEEPEFEIPVAIKMANYYTHETFNKFNINSDTEYSKHRTEEISGIGADNTRIVVGETFKKEPKADYTNEEFEALNINPVTINEGSDISDIKNKLRKQNQVQILQFNYHETNLEALQLKAAADAGFFLLDGFGDGIQVKCPTFSPGILTDLSFSILQASRVRITKTEYISCPGCGRTLFALQDTLAKIKSRTAHLKNLKIGVMGCIVNGPGEMADADYGYVGAGAGKITLYKSREVVKKNIPEEEAVEELINIIKENGDWADS